MNWLAHLLLSETEIDYQLGNLLADPLKGRYWAGSSRALRRGFEMHRRIDYFTDSHTRVSTSKSRLGHRGYLRGVVIDMVYDHILTTHWDTYVETGLETFIGQFHDQALEVVADYPAQARGFVERLVRSNTLLNYATLEQLETSLARLDFRLSERLRARETAVGYLPLLDRELANLERDFHHFFPELVELFITSSGVESNRHWLRRAAPATV